MLTIIEKEKNVSSIGEKVTSTNNTMALLPTFTLKENAKFQVGISKNICMYFFLSSMNSTHKLKVKNSCVKPRLIQSKIPL